MLKNKETDALIDQIAETIKSVGGDIAEFLVGNISTKMRRLVEKNKIILKSKLDEIDNKDDIDNDDS